MSFCAADLLAAAICAAVLVAAVALEVVELTEVVAIKTFAQRVYRHMNPILEFFNSNM
jgi:hypothetical protein